ncbi:hypothetical protein [Rhodohalobacter sp. 8-1]|uniref:hypothetical protein n=1 Tax=Rhodohalobacter sp. 8-1 TaxID=3131972 RepID=UPI0030EE9611
MIALFLNILLFSAAVQDTTEPVTPADSISFETAGSDSLQQMMQQQAEEEEEPVIIQIWRYNDLPGFESTETDSSLRWVNTLNLTQRFYRYPGAFTYRTGTLGRMDAVQMHTFENRHFETELDGLQLNDPLTGAVNWNRVPVHKISTMNTSSFGPDYRTNIRLRDHYLVQPRTYLNFDESTYNFRNLEFAATHNVTPGTNIELSYWDRRDGIGYNRSVVEGNQILLRGYHQLNSRWLLRGAYITNSLEQQQPFGYVLNDPSLFPFNPFIASPNEGSASSDKSTKDIYLQTHFRRDSSRAVQTEFGFHYQTNERSLTYSADTVATDFRQIELYARQRLQKNEAKATVTVRPFFLENRTEQLLENKWTGVKGNLTGSLAIGPALELSATGSGTFRSDSRYDVKSGARLRLSIGSGLELSAFGGYASQSPDLQALYWQSEAFSGNRDLLNEQSLTAGAEATLGLGSYFSFDGRVDLRQVEQGVFVNRTNAPVEEFINIDPYTSMSATGTLNLDSPLFEGMASATYKRFESSASDNPVNIGLQNSGDRVWLKGSMYWKNYLFDRATFVKAGLVGMYSPNFMRSAEYIVPLNRWQHGTQELLNPPYSRVDIDLSARIRWFMVLLRWENIFDRVTQPGYFETVGYPMPQQRFILGLRVLFTN